MNKRDWYLNKLDITQYILRNPQVIKGEARIDITENIRLIVISKTPPQEKIFHDILNAIHVSHDDCLYLMPSQLLMPVEQIYPVMWFINETIPENWSQQTLANKPIIMTNSLMELAKSPQQKRQLWQILCQYENYFRTDAH